MAEANDMLKATFLCEMTLDIPPGYQIDQGTLGSRVVAPIAGGRFTGPKLSGRVLPAGGDWLIIRPDGVMTIDVRALLETNDGSLIHLAYMAGWSFHRISFRWR